jgi:hypothetical protein
MMAVNIRRFVTLAALAGLMAVSVAVLTFTYVEIGVTEAVGEGRLSVSAYDFSHVPQSVLDDASRLAEELYGGSRDKYQDFVNQLLATYLEAEDKDFIIVFNSGGWGWNSAENFPGWKSILDGVAVELDGLGYTSLLLNYRRTSETWQGQVKEFIEGVKQYPSKASNLVSRVQFVTAHLPETRVIVAGESNGSVISDTAMCMLRDNPQVYSIQTGPPFWHKQATWERTLVLDNNGTTPDTFTRGDIPAMIWASLKGALGLLPPEENPGTIFKVMRAPGHDYSWQYPYVYSRIVNFLQENFGGD